MRVVLLVPAVVLLVVVVLLLLVVGFDPRDRGVDCDVIGRIDG